MADVSGGYSEYKGQADVYQYDMENDKWQTVSTLIHPRYSHSVAVVENWSSYLQYCSLNPWGQHKHIFYSLTENKEEKQPFKFIKFFYINCTRN